MNHIFPVCASQDHKTGKNLQLPYFFTIAYIMAKCIYGKGYRFFSLPCYSTIVFSHSQDYLDSTL